MGWQDFLNEFGRELLPRGSFFLEKCACAGPLLIGIPRIRNFKFTCSNSMLDFKGYHIHVPTT